MEDKTTEMRIVQVFLNTQENKVSISWLPIGHTVYVEKTKKLARGVSIDYDRNGYPLGIEITGVRELVKGEVYSAPTRKKR